MDLSNLSLEDLRVLSVQVASAIRQEEQKVAKEAREKILIIAQQAGISLDELISRPPNPKQPKQQKAVQYRHPEDNTKEWSGRGRKPHWIVEWVESGKSLDALRV